jgi:AraC family transcriptional regulator, regulatory protein of adaptative response / DNA-3-methyladenine glycosylase II
MNTNLDACFEAFRNGDARYDGLFFLGTCTTRDDCRPGCTAYPLLPEYAVLFVTAAAAHAKGFRPCLH